MGKAEYQGLDAIEAITERKKFTQFVNWLARQSPEDKFYKTDMADGAGLGRNTINRGYVDAALKMGILEKDGAFYRVNQESDVFEALRAADGAIRREVHPDDFKWR